MSAVTFPAKHAHSAPELCTATLEAALNAPRADGVLVLRLPAGRYALTREVVMRAARRHVVITGEGAGATVLAARGCSGLALNFLQNGFRQDCGLELRGVGFEAEGAAGTALRVSYGSPPVTNEHFKPSVSLRDVVVSSSARAAKWTCGIELDGAWNATLDHVFMSGAPPVFAGDKPDWNTLEGAGLVLRGMCVNTHLTNVRANFWTTGIAMHSAAGVNAEGLFCANCSMVAVKRGVWLRGSPDGTGRISTFTWRGGMIENRVEEVVGGGAAFHLERVWTALIGGVQCITDSNTNLAGHTYGVLAQDCHGVVVEGSDLNAYTHGVVTTGGCRGVNVRGNTFTNTVQQVLFTPGTKGSRSGGNVRVNNARDETDLDGENLIEA